MVFPQLVKNLKKNIFLQQMHNVFRNMGVFGLQFIFQRFDNLAPHGFGIHFRLFGPIGNREVKAGNAQNFLLQFINRPFGRCQM